MDENGGHRENGRHKPDMYKPAHSQWLMQQPQSMKHIMSIMAERDAAIQERNMVINEKNKACEERDIAIMERDTAIQEKNDAIIERDNALAALHFRQNAVNGSNSCPPEGQISQGVKHMHHSHDGESSYDERNNQVPEALPVTAVPTEDAKSRKVKRPKDPNSSSPNKKTAKSGRKVKKESEDFSTILFSKPPDWKGVTDWKGPELGLNQVAFDETTMPPPVCSCTGIYRQCYKWGNGGWQSSCCTTTLSMYPLPAVPNKRHARVGGRKMSGSAFSKLLSRLAAEGHDLSTPVDLKENWAKHGTNRYITIK